MRNHLCWLIIVSNACSSAWCADRNVVTAAATKADPATNPVEIREFEVRVDNRAVGTHRISIKADGPTHKADIRTDVRVDVIVYAYVFKLRANESWRDDRLEDIDMRCEDGSKKRSFTLKTEGETYQMSFNGKPVASQTSRCVMSTAYWKLPPKQQREKAFMIADVDNGAAKQATLVLVGPDTVTADGRSWACKHYKIDGPSPAELWFDDQDRLVRQKSVEQGHKTELNLKQIRLSKDDN